MKPALPVLAGMIAIIALAGAKHHKVLDVPVFHQISVTPHVFPPLTPAQKLAAVQLFHLNNQPTSGNPTYTLSAQTPLSTQMGATLSAVGTWFTASNVNQIVMGSPDVSSWAQVDMANNNPRVSYVVTFNVTVTGQPVTLTLGSAIHSPTGYKANPVVPTVTANSTMAIPLVLPPAYNSAAIQFSAPQGTFLYLESVTIQQL